MELGPKLGIYWVISIISVALVLLLRTPFAFPFIFIVAFWFMFVVYHDAPKRGLSENWWIIVFLLGAIGGTIYYLKAKGKPKKKEPK